MKTTADKRTFADGDIEGYEWPSTDMPPDQCAKILGYKSPEDLALATLRSLDLVRSGAWQANHRARYVAANSELARRARASHPPQTADDRPPGYDMETEHEQTHEPRD